MDWNLPDPYTPKGRATILTSLTPSTTEDGASTPPPLSHDGTARDVTNVLTIDGTFEPAPPARIIPRARGGPEADRGEAIASDELLRRLRAT